MALSFLFLALAHWHEWHIVVAVTFLGFGIGLSLASMTNLILDAVPQRQTGEATGMNTIMRTVGGAFGAQIGAAIVAGQPVSGTVITAESSFTGAFVVSSACVALALLAAALIPRPAFKGALAASAARDLPPAAADMRMCATSSRVAGA